MPPSVLARSRSAASADGPGRGDGLAARVEAVLTPSRFDLSGLADGHRPAAWRPSRSDHLRDRPVPLAGVGDLHRVGRRRHATTQTTTSWLRDGVVPPHAPTRCLDKIDDDPAGATTRRRSGTVEFLTAEARGAIGLVGLKQLLGLTAEAIATDEYETAKSAVSS